MAIKYAFDLYPRLNPIAGARIRRFAQLQEAEYKGEANGTGSGRMVLRGTSTDAGSIDPEGLQYNRVRRINTDVIDGSTLSGFSEAVVGGFFLDNGAFDALTERSTKKLTFGGAGTLSYLGRAVAADEPYYTSVATSTRWKVATTGAPPAGWHTVGFNDSGYANAVHVTDPRWVYPESRRWIWEHTTQPAGSGEERSFRREFTLPSVPANPQLLVAADNGCEVRINGTLVATMGAGERGFADVEPFDFDSIQTVAIDPSLLTTGLNCISIIGWNGTQAEPGPAGVYAALIDPDLPGPVDGVWEFTDQTLGSILWRMVSEALSANRPQQPIPGVTMTFSATLDSDGNAWTDTFSFRVQVGEGLLSIIRRLMQAGLYVSMNPDTFALSAWPATAHGRDRTGVAWGANVVRFQAPTDATIATGNIKSDAKRGIGALIERSDLLVGSSAAYEWVNNAAADLVWEGGYQIDDAAGTDLAALGAAQLQARADAGDTVRLRQKVGNDPATGQYLPFEHDQLDDRITLHTGTGPWEWNETEQNVAAISLKLRTGSDWDAWVDLGSRYASIEQRAFQVTPVGAHTHPPNPQLCDPEVACSALVASQMTARTATNGDAENAAGIQWSGGGYQTSQSHGGARSYGILTGTSADIVYTWDPAQVFLAGVRYVIEVWGKQQTAITQTMAFGVPGVDEVIDGWTAGPPDANDWRKHRLCWTPRAHRTGVRYRFASTQTPSGFFLLDDLALYTAPSGEFAGTSTQAARCDHGHADASSLTIEEEDGTPSDLFDTLKVPNGSLTDNGDGSASLEAVLPRHGGREIVQVHGNTGSTETVDLALGNVHDLTLDANCTLTLTGALNGKACSVSLLLRQDGIGSRTVTWPGSVTWPAGTAPTLATAAGSVDFVVLLTIDGGTIWYGFHVGSALVADLDDLTDVTITSPADLNHLIYDATAAQWENSAGFWRPLMDGAGAVITDGGTGEAVMAFQ